MKSPNDIANDILGAWKQRTGHIRADVPLDFIGGLIYDAIEAERADAKALADVARGIRIQFRLAGITPLRDSMNPAEDLLHKADVALAAYEARTEQPTAVSDVVESAKEDSGASAPVGEDQRNDVRV